MVIEIFNKDTKREISRNILNDLPEWFGLPESTQSYIDDCVDMPFFAYYHLNEPIGYIVLNETSKDTGDIFVVGILKQYHRHGIGKELYICLENFAVNRGYSFLQVKTVKSGCYESYDKTNNFYKAMGFKELECFPKMWDEWNPCQIYVKYIGK